MLSVAAAAGIPEKYFHDGWSRTEALPASVPAPTASLSATGQNLPIDIQHNPFAHMHITQKAYELYASRYDGGELSRFIGGYDDNGPRSDNDDTIVGGSYDEDKPFKNPFNEVSSILRHFWDCRGGFGRGLAGYDSSVNRAYKYWNGGFGFDGSYDLAWSKNDNRRPGKRGEGVLSLYRRGEKARAFWYLGHVAHLLEDITVPAHAQLWPHPVSGSDSYEKYISERYKDWGGLPTGTIESFPSLYELFLRTALVSKGFDAGYKAGDYGGKDGEIDRGRRRADGFSEQELKEEANVLLPLAIKRAAALFVLFYKEVDSTPPALTLSLSPGPDGHLILSAVARDSQSGVDKTGYRFEYAALEGSSWTAWAVAPAAAGPDVLFPPAPGTDYAFRARVSDAAGNNAVSQAVGFPHALKTP